jgi:hypothetical protein
MKDKHTAFIWELHLHCYSSLNPWRSASDSMPCSAPWSFSSVWSIQRCHLLRHLLLLYPSPGTTYQLNFKQDRLNGTVVPQWAYRQFCLERCWKYMIKASHNVGSQFRHHIIIFITKFHLRLFFYYWTSSSTMTVEDYWWATKFDWHGWTWKRVLTYRTNRKFDHPPSPSLLRAGSHAKLSSCMGMKVCTMVASGSTTRILFVPRFHLHASIMSNTVLLSSWREYRWALYVFIQ